MSTTASPLRVNNTTSGLQTRRRVGRYFLFLRASRGWDYYEQGSNPLQYPKGNMIPKVTEEQLHNVYASIDPYVLGKVKYLGLRGSLDNRQVIIYRNFCDDLSAQFLDVLLTDNPPEHLPIENSIRAIFIHELSEPSDPVEFISESVANIEAEFSGIKWFGGTDKVLIDGQ